MRRIAVLCLMLALAGCAHAPAPDAQVPSFAREAYAPFSRSAAIQLALREWRLFGSPVDDEAPQDKVATPDKPERMQGLWQRVGEYWWLGMPNGATEQRWTGEHDGQGRIFPPQNDGSYAWSAAFISYIMRMAGAGPLFPYAADHAFYINAAAGRSGGYAVEARDPAAYAPQQGDLICLGRRSARMMSFADLPAPTFPSHCDLVVDTAPDALTVIGGNVDDAVTMKHVPLTPEGLLFDATGMPVDPRYSWFVVIRVLYRAQ